MAELGDDRPAQPTGVQGAMSVEHPLARGRWVAFGVATTLLVLGVLELGLLLGAAASPRVALLLSTGIPLTIPDTVLGMRPNPAAPDHDAAGWRNAERPEAVRMVAIGDSQTYGHIVARDEAWPQRLQVRFGVTVYNMSLGGYGPVEYLLVLDEALRLRPELVLVGLYAGNDLFGSYSSVYGQGGQTSLRSRDRAVLAAVAEADASRPPLVSAWDRTRDARTGRWEAWGAALDPLRKYSRLWGLARAARRALRGPPAASVVADMDGGAAASVPGDPALLLPIGEGRLATVLTPLQRLTVTDQSDPRIAEGARISIDALVRMAHRCASACEVVAVFLPTKELVFGDFVARNEPSPPRELALLLHWEERFWEQARGRLEAHGIRSVDALPALRAALARGDNPYPSDWDGHLNALGNDVVAAAVAGSMPLQELTSADPATFQAKRRTSDP